MTNKSLIPECNDVALNRGFRGNIKHFVSVGFGYSYAYAVQCILCAVLLIITWIAILRYLVTYEKTNVYVNSSISFLTGC